MPSVPGIPRSSINRRAPNAGLFGESCRTFGDRDLEACTLGRSFNEVAQARIEIDDQQTIAQDASHQRLSYKKTHISFKYNLKRRISREINSNI